MSNTPSFVSKPLHNKEIYHQHLKNVISLTAFVTTNNLFVTRGKFKMLQHVTLESQISISNATALAVQGAIKTTSVDESKAAARLIERCLKSMNEMETLARESNFDAIGKIVANPDFLNFENAATLLVRSDLLTSDEKVSFIILCRQLFDY